MLDWITLCRFIRCTDADAVVNQVACQVFGVFSLKTRMKIIWSLMLATYLDLHQPSWCVCVQCAVCLIPVCVNSCVSLLRKRPTDVSSFALVWFDWLCVRACALENWNKRLGLMPPQNQTPWCASVGFQFHWLYWTQCMLVCDPCSSMLMLPANY